ncbi:nitrite/sulfite reductase [Cupriavidus plantarum]|uniref:nitrite/sulfite reductase n=1 Tax=Cupriavidus plantarum TaxID=942865 RepID=UPI000E245B41|nr:nitrite/sulfite reductase [Cupriavidus plantarum]NYH99191.1 sulfite reductase (NADPH) hemoprotein beta-component [Cupriavidus plantarum]REF02832.1 sulfite reductase (NADPH) beta subunit [Cupriavidus plantarum]RLK44304.1 sulfite reductase (NADPH) beta subunit [Cupriavidus plantarum]CAG2142429.1 Sulfite reductase [ferredoxin] [Cupriavidus plantarum]SMR65505.1 sulfite reductase (NADPH) beta subunit [Cupriavidus plantarum]
MYQYDQYDQRIVNERVAQFRDQVQRRLSGELTEEEFLPLRLQNGLYMQRHAYMLRVAIPYGLLSSKQLRMLAHIARTYDRGYGHFSTRQNIQYNWMDLERVPDVLADLASVEMHGIQTSGNCVRNITTDHFAGVAPDEYVDPRVLAELLRQWSTFQPEFAFLPRKFKIAINASANDRAVIQMHDIGIEAYRNAEGETRLRIWAGGGLGRTPILGTVIKEDLPWQHLLSYVESAIRVYNRYGRRDNKYKARIKILVKAIGAEKFAQEVEEEWQFSKDGPGTLTQEEFDRVAQYFAPPAYEKLPDTDASYEKHLLEDKAFARWVSRNVHGHKVAGYAAVTLSTKPGPASPPGDATDVQMDTVADLADRFGFGELRVAHEQNLILPDVKKRDLFELWQLAKKAGLATANIGLLTDIIACPGGDFCSLANAKSLPIAAAIQERFEDLDYVYDLGEISLNISGCINACGHHHVGNIGVLGVDKDGSEWYQVTLGGAQGNDASLGKVIGPSFSAEEMPDVVSRIIDTFVANRIEDEAFMQTLSRIGIAPFKERVYADKQRERAEA